MTEIHGTCDPRFEAVRTAFAGNFDQGLEIGACCAIVHRGEMVVDLWAGYRDVEQTQPWESDTIVNVWSSTKTMMFLVALLLADRGELDLYAPVARYWPEFAANGKDEVEVRHLLAHSAGLSGLQEPVTPDDVLDHHKIAGLLAAQAPWWEPGTMSGYHAMTQGYLIGEVVRRVTGQRFGAFLASEVAGPLGADFHVGLDPAHDHRVSPVVPAAQGLPPGLDPSSVAARTFANPAVDAAVANTAGWRRADLPAVNGTGNARSMALLQSIISHGGEAGGRRFLSAAGVERLFDQQSHGVDLVLGVPMRFGMGFGLNAPDVPISPNPRACFWGGWGGSLIINDLDAELTVAYAMNRMGDGTLGDLRGFSVVMAAHMAAAAA